MIRHFSGRTALEAEIIFRLSRWSQKKTVFQSASQLFGIMKGKGSLGQWAFRTHGSLSMQAQHFSSSHHSDSDGLLVQLYFRFSYHTQGWITKEPQRAHVHFVIDDYLLIT